MNYFTQMSLIQKTLKSLEDSLRGTGRSKAVLDSVKDGDVLLVLESRELDCVRRTLQMKGVKVDVFAVGTDLGKVNEKLQGKVYKNVHFDHHLIESLVSYNVERLFKDLHFFVRQNHERLTAENVEPFEMAYKTKGPIL